MANNEKTLQENINESFNKTNQIIFETQTHCCDIRKSIIDKEQENIETINYCKMGKITAVCIENTNYDNKVEIMLDNYEIKKENGKYYAVKKKPQYPKTYEECCDILGRTLPINDDVEGYKWELIMNLQKLIICRDVYWKIAGEQMKLGKPWEPDLQDKQQTKYVITNVGGNIAFEKRLEYNTIICFPTAEMRDAFYENFKDLIEKCKELL